MNLVKMVQKAHAGELGAYHAYQGHWESLKDVQQREAIKMIQQDELEHIYVLEKMLEHLNAKPSKLRDITFIVIGKSLSFLCRYTGWFMPMYGAMLIEEIGVDNYYEMMEVALTQGRGELAFTFMHLMSKEKAHKDYLEELIKNGRARKE